MVVVAAYESNNDIKLNADIINLSQQAAISTHSMEEL
jgi:hypothetical protein